MKKISQNKYGHFTIEIPEEVVADGEIGWHIRFELAAPIAKGGGIRVLFPAYAHQRSVEYVQVVDYWKSHFIYAYFEEEDARIATKVEKIDSDFSHILRWKDSDRIAFICAEEEWPAGSVLHICYGGIDRMWLKGYAVPTRAPHHVTLGRDTVLKYEWSIDSQGNGKYHNIELCEGIKIRPDRAAYLCVVTPTLVNPKQIFEIRYTVRDRFHNPIWDYKENPEFLLRNLKTGEEKKITGYIVSIEENGIYEVDCTNENLITEKAVICCKETDKFIYWGDTHCHTTLTPNIRDNNNGTCPQDAYDYAKEVAKLDFVGLVEQTFLFDDNEKLNITRQLWNQIAKLSNQNNQSSELVTFPGFELHSKRGDTVVLFAEDMMEISYPTGISDIYEIWSLYQGKKYLTIPHFHRYCGGRPAKDQQEQQHSGFDLKNWLASDEAEVLCEFYSAQWGRFEYPDNPMLLKAMSNLPENNVVSFLNRGKHWGMTAGSDDHDSMPGHGGLTAVYADDLTRPGIYEGLKSRYSYATTHTRVYLDVRLGKIRMGEAILPDEGLSHLTFQAEIAAPVNIRTIEWIVNGKIYQKIRVNCPFVEVRLSLSKSEFQPNDYLYVRVKLENEDIIVSSPIWVEK